MQFQQIQRNHSHKITERNNTVRQVNALPVRNRGEEMLVL